MSANLYFSIGTIALVIISLFFSVQFFRGRLTWGQVRLMGVPMAVYGWIGVIYYLMLFEGIYGLVGFILDLPIWIDISLFLVILGLSMAVYFKLIHREKFKPAVFTTAFLVPLSVPGCHMLAKLMPSKAPVGILQPNNTTAKVLSDFPQWNKVGDSGYLVRFKNSHEKGKYGDSLTAKQLTAKGEGYRKSKSKTNKIHGIDGVVCAVRK